MFRFAIVKEIRGISMKKHLLSLLVACFSSITALSCHAYADSQRSSNNLSSDVSGSKLISQLLPDRMMAQGVSAGINSIATPIPPVVSGNIDMEEFKVSNVVELKVGQSRSFRLKNRVVRTSISQPGIVEPVVVAENQLVLLGKTPGSATMVLWDDAGNVLALDLRVNRDYSQLQSTLREIDPRIIVKAFSIVGGDRVILLGDVDYVESVIRAFNAANVFMDDKGMNVDIANNRVVSRKGMGSMIGEMGMGMQGGSGGASGLLSTIASVDKYTFFSNNTNNVAKAQVISSNGGRVVSLIKVRKVPVIVLHVTFMEMNTTAVRELGVQLGINLATNSFNFGIGGNNGNALASAGIPQSFGFPGLLTSAAAAGALLPTGGAGGFLTGPVSFVSSSLPNISGIGLGLLNTAPALLQSAVLFGSPGSAAFSPSGLANLFTSVAQLPINGTTKVGINPTINGIIAMSRARILAQPTLSCLSGERAAFLAGGEIPIIQQLAVAGAALPSIQYEPFGLRLDFIPMLMENGTINLQVSPEERILDTSIGFNPPGTSTSTVIPGFTTRRSQTIVELKPGQELFIAGMVSASAGRQIIKTPIIGEVPVLGALYRSKAFNKNESELVVAVRPEIILPGTPGSLKLPEEIDRVEAPHDMNMFQVEPTVIDERYYSSGRDERDTRTTPTLPPGAPIPDTE